MNNLRSVPTISIILLSIAAGIVSAGCHDGEASSAGGRRDAAVTISGDTITIPPGARGLDRFSVRIIRPGRAMISAVAPARVVASITRPAGSDEPVILFDSPDVTSLYSQFRQARINSARMTKNLERIREMYKSQGATASELTNAESDASTAAAAAAETDGHLRSLGFNPRELGEVPGGTVWLMCDVPENQMNEVQKGEEVTVMFSSRPGSVFTGHATAVGEVVDPVTRTVKVRVTLPNPYGHLLPGMFARVEFGDPRDGLMLIPNSSVVSVEGKEYAFIRIREGEFERRAVITQAANDSELVVLKGIGSGEAVVCSGAMLLKGLSFGY